MDSAGADVAAAIWLSPNPTLGGRNMQPDMHRWIADVGGVKGHKLPMLFVWGKNDPADPVVLNYLKSFDINYQRDPKKDPPDPPRGLELTGEKILDAKLVGSKLLDPNLGTSAFITKTYLDAVLKKRGAGQWKARDNNNEYFYWKVGGSAVLAKLKGEKVPLPLPPAVVGLR